MAMLVVMMGLPGAGKSAVADGVARAIAAPVFSVDPLEATLNRAGITRDHRSDYAAYDLVATLARSQLVLGQSAVVDAVNSIELVRAWWRDLAAEFGVARPLIECVCTDHALHRRRLEARRRDIRGFLYEDAAAWPAVERRRAEYEICREDRLIVDAVRVAGPLLRPSATSSPTGGEEVR
jgi:predicted kinase